MPEKLEGNIYYENKKMRVEKLEVVVEIKQNINKSEIPQQQPKKIRKSQKKLGYKKKFNLFFIMGLSTGSITFWSLFFSNNDINKSLGISVALGFSFGIMSYIAAKKISSCCKNNNDPVI